MDRFWLAPEKNERSYGGGAAAKPDADGGTACLAHIARTGAPRGAAPPHSVTIQACRNLYKRDQHDTDLFIGRTEETTDTGGKQGQGTEGRGSPGVSRSLSWTMGSRWLRDFTASQRARHRLD